MPVVAGVPTHRTTTAIFDGAHYDAGSLVRYEGEPHWTLEPLDPVAAEAWRGSVADPRRVLDEGLRQRKIVSPPMSPAEIEREEAIRRSRGLPIRI